MNELIAKGLKEQLRVLSIFLDEYKKELDGEILDKFDYAALKGRTDYIKEFITNKYHI
jgi:hypothetical protein